MSVNNIVLVFLFAPLLTIQFRLDRSAGLGDFGKGGIERFIHQHRCNDICRTLSLPPLTVPDKLLENDISAPASTGVSNESDNNIESGASAHSASEY